MKTAFKLAAAVALSLTTPSYARCGGGGGYCSQDSRDARRVEELATMVTAYSRHDHPTWERRVSDHQMLDYYRRELESACRHTYRRRTIEACREAGQ